MKHTLSQFSDASEFTQRHIGPGNEQVSAMLHQLGAPSLDAAPKQLCELLDLMRGVERGDLLADGVLGLVSVEEVVDDLVEVSAEEGTDISVSATVEAPARPIIWMRGMRFPLDILWIRDVRVVDLVAGTTPARDGFAPIARHGPHLRD